MKKLFAIGAAIVAFGFANSANAADMPVKAPVAPVAAPYNWTGLYVGANGGWGTSRKCWDFAGNGGVAVVPNLADGCHNATGGTVGGQIGYNWQVGTWVFGLEAQGNWANFRGENLSNTFAPQINFTKIDAFGLFTGRVGYAWNNALLYVKGGAIALHDKYEQHVTTFTTASETRWGGAAGAGFEYGFTPNWSAAVEYDHGFLGARDVTFTNTDVYHIKQDVDIVTARINYRWGGARY